MGHVSRNGGAPDWSSLSGALRHLSADDLAAVLLARPEAALVAERDGADLGLVAGVLARPNGIERAIAELDEFRLQLLIVATWFHTDASVSLLRSQARGVASDRLASAAAGLARSGLAFPSGDRRAWSLWVPQCVAQVVERLGDPGPPARPALGQRTVDDLELVEAGLLCHDGDAVTASDEASRWARQSAAAKWATLFEAWRGALLWSESDDGPVPVSGGPFVDHSGVRAAVLETLRAVAPRVTIDATSLAAA
jgi:hypothetical protein